MNKKSLIGKFGAVALSATMLAGGILPSVGHAEEKYNNLQPYVFSEVVDKYFPNISEDQKNINKVLHTVKSEEKKYLSEEEIRGVDPDTVYNIYVELKEILESNVYTEDELNQLVASKIKQNVTKSAVNRATYPGIGDLTSAEADLAKKYPAEFVKYAACALEALKEAEKYYSSSQLLKGNGDAFRHAYWNAILVPSLGAMNGPAHGEARAVAWTNAHEQNSSGIDKEMDLHNNWIGRMLAYENYFSYSNAQYSSKLRQMVAQGALARIVNGQLVATNGTM